MQRSNFPPWFGHGPESVMWFDRWTQGLSLFTSGCTPENSQPPANALATRTQGNWVCLHRWSYLKRKAFKKSFSSIRHERIRFFSPCVPCHVCRYRAKTNMRTNAYHHFIYGSNCCFGIWHHTNVPHRCHLYLLSLSMVCHRSHYPVWASCIVKGRYCASKQGHSWVWRSCSPILYLLLFSICF